MIVTLKSNGTISLQLQATTLIEQAFINAVEDATRVGTPPKVKSIRDHNGVYSISIELEKS